MPLNRHSQPSASAFEPDLQCPRLCTRMVPASREAAPGRACKPSGTQGSAFTHAQTPDSGARGASGLPRLHAPQGAILGHHRILSLPTHTPATLPRPASGHTYLRVQVLAWGGVCPGATEIRTASAIQDTQTRLGFLPLQHFTLHDFTLTRKHTHSHTALGSERLSSPSSLGGGSPRKSKQCGREGAEEKGMEIRVTSPLQPLTH